MYPRECHNGVMGSLCLVVCGTKRGVYQSNQIGSRFMEISRGFAMRKKFRFEIIDLLIATIFILSLAYCWQMKIIMENETQIEENAR